MGEWATMAAATLTTTEEQATKQFLEQVNAHSTQQNGSPVPWTHAVTFLMARKFDVHRAVDLYYAHEDVRTKEGLSTVDPFEEAVRRELLTEKFTVLPSRDSAGAAIALFTARYHHPPRTSHQAVLKGLVFQLDTAIQSVETQRNGLVFIYDMSGSKFSNFDYELSIKILSMLKGSYPARLKKVLIVTAPLWFKAPFRILRLFVREKLRDRVFTVSVPNLPLHIPVECLPQRLGGTLALQHPNWLRTCLLTYDATDNHKMAEFFTPVDNGNLSTPNTPTSTQNGDSSSGILSSDIDSMASTGDDQEKEVSVEKDLRYKNPGKPPPGGTGKISRKKRPHSGDSSDLEESIHGPEASGMTIKELMEYVRIKGRRGLIREYGNIKKEPPAGSFMTSKQKHNLPKNRYTDVLCLDQTRVRLQAVESDPSSDYINGNFVDGYKHKNAYISTQGPLLRTFPDFWRMIWEQNVLIIVMTTRTVERSCLKCGQYWPLEVEEGDPFDEMTEPGMQYGNFIVINTGFDRLQDYTVTNLLVQNCTTGETREVTHFQFTGWPDYGVPHSGQAFLQFMFHVRRHQAERVAAMGDLWSGHPLGPPILVHCSAGIGRTGTFITMNILTQRLNDIGTVDVQKTVRLIRSQRAFSIQMPDQYVFVHIVLLEHAQQQGLLDAIDLTGFDDSSSESE